MSAHLLSWLIALPVLGGVATLVSGGADANRARWVALVFALATLALCVPLLSGFDAMSSSMTHGARSKPKAISCSACPGSKP